MGRTARASLFALAAMILLLASVPLGSAQLASQFGAVTKCSKECTPAELNGPQPKRGNATVKTILYAHVEDLLNLVPLNTQAPQGPDLNRGGITPSIQTRTGICIPPGSPTCIDVNFKQNERVLFSSPGLVEYSSFGWRTVQVPGLGEELKLVGPDIILYWYLSPGATAAGPPLVPEIRIDAVLRAGGKPGRGTVIAESSPEGVRRTMVAGPQDGMYAYEFRIPMRIREPILSADGFHVVVRIGQASHPFWDGDVGNWRVRTGPTFLPRLVLETERVAKTVASSVSRFQDHVFLRWTYLDVWGGYDMPDAGLRIVQESGPRLPTGAPELVILRRAIEHDGHLRPLNATWRIPYIESRLPEGSYRFRATAENLQGTYVLDEEFAFDVAGGIPQVPAVGMATFDGQAPSIGVSGLILAALGAGAILARRRP